MNDKIRIRGLDKYYGRGDRRTHALHDVNLDVAAGEFITLVGASGCGKSTLLRTLGGLEEYADGSLLCNGRDVDGPGPDRAMVFQSYSLYPWLNVIDNIRFSRRLAHHRAATSSDVEIASGRAEALVNLMGLGHVARAYPAELSGGMQQRVAIARALMSRPDVLLMDARMRPMSEYSTWPAVRCAVCWAFSVSGTFRRSRRSSARYSSSETLARPSTSTKRSVVPRRTR